MVSKAAVISRIHRWQACWWEVIDRGVHPLCDHDTFSPLYQISPYFRKIFWLCGKLSTFYLFPKNFLDFHPPKFLITFFYFPLFSLFRSISPLFRENYYSLPYLDKFPLCFRKIHLLFTYIFCISFPPTLTMMHLYITKCTNWTPLVTETKLVQMWWGCLQGRIKGSTGP